MAQRRLGYIDQFRGLATIFMIETHVLNALLLTSLRGDFTFKAVDFLNGLVAPSFLFVAGFSFTLALSRKGDAYRRFSPELFRHMRRLLFIWVTGYALHVPFFSLRKSVYEISPAGVIAFTAVDILQCIAVTLIILHLLRVLVKDDRKFNVVVYFLFLFFILAAPFAGGVDFTRTLPLTLAQYFSRGSGSLFPLFPWASFLIGGTIASQFLTSRSDPSSPGGVDKPALRRILRVGGGLVIAGAALSAVEKNLYNEPHFADYSPFWFLLRFGLLLVILYGVATYEGVRKSDFSGVKLFGRESFFIYVLHLVIVYGSSANFPSLVMWIGPTLGYAECILIFVVLSGVMYLVARLWNDLKRENYQISRQVQYGFITVALYLFISRPY